VITEKRSARRLRELIAEHPDFEVLDAIEADPFHFRYVPDALTGRLDEPAVATWLDRLNREIATALTRSRLAVVRMSRIRGRLALRLATASTRTLELDVDQVFDALAHAGRCLSRPLPPPLARSGRAV
jgi:glutamate/tyrosine decarboxylase-like PLP-dependent enzyme